VSTSAASLEALIASRLSAAGLTVERGISELAAFLQLLAKWNRSINLTALSLARPSDAAVDRLIVEPVSAARFISADAAVWFDLGSGGGSPAIPMKVARPDLRLTMVEATAKKAAFLREAIRALGLSDTTVEAGRFEEVSADPRYVGRGDLVTARAVRTDESFYRAARELLGRAGQLWVFRSATAEKEPASNLFSESENYWLPAGGTRLQVLDACSTWNIETD